MTFHDPTKKTDAELVWFCTVIARTLTTLNRRLVASGLPDPADKAAVVGLTKRVDAALVELEKRTIP